MNIMRVHRKIEIPLMEFYREGETVFVWIYWTPWNGL